MKCDCIINTRGVFVMDHAYQKLADAIRRYPRQRIELGELYEMVEKSLESKEISNVSRCFETIFVQLIDTLIRNGIIEPFKTLKPNHRGLYSRYKKINHSENNDLIKVEIISSVIQPMDVSYYLAHPKEYLKDKTYIDKLADFFRNRHKTPGWLTVNERSYEIFGDEKFLKGSERARSRGESIIRKLGLTYDDLYCKLTLEPFFCFLKDSLANKQERKVYIIENKDTFWSFKDTAFDSDSIQEVDMLIYGEGRKIISSFQFVSEYGLNENDEYYYFGDLDPEGINIYAELSEHYKDRGYYITPYKPGYRQLLSAAEGRAVSKVPKDQVLNKNSLAAFVKHFSQEDGYRIREILLGGGYVPQEAFSAEKMRQMYLSRME